MKKFFTFLAAATVLVAFASCSKEEPTITLPDYGTHGALILAEGNIGKTNSSLAFVDNEGNLSREVFKTANNEELGGVAQSITKHDNKLWIVLNGSNCIKVVNPKTWKQEGVIEGLQSPRYIHFVSPTKAYVTQMYTDKIAIISTESMSVIGSITVKPLEEFSTKFDPMGMSSEKMIQVGSTVYVNCWTGTKLLLGIDTATDKIVKQMEVGVQPFDMTVDNEENIWVITDGGGDWTAEGVGQEAPAIHKVNLTTWTKEDYGLNPEWGWHLAFDKVNDRLYISSGMSVKYINTKDVKFKTIEEKKVLETNNFADEIAAYSIAVNPDNQDVWVGDALDFSQSGKMHIFDKGGNKQKVIDNVGIIPGFIMWK